MTPSPEQVVAEGRSLLRLLATLDTAGEQGSRDQFRTYCDRARKRVQAIVDRNQEIIGARQDRK